MKRTYWKRFGVKAAAWVGLLALCGVVALAQSQTQGQRTDGQIEMDVVQALNASYVLKNDLITAATVNGEVTLSGTVSSASSRSLAEQIVLGVRGVTAVHNGLKVGNPADDANAQNVGPADDPGAPDESDSQPGDEAQQPGEGPAPAYGQAGPPPDSQNYPEDNGQNPPPQYGQTQPPVYGQHAPPPPDDAQGPPDYGQAGPPPGYGQQRPYYGEGPGPGDAGPAGPGPAGPGPEPQGPSDARNPYPGGQQQYPQYGVRQPNYRVANEPVTVAPGTLMRLRTAEPVGSKRAVEGTPVEFTVIQDVMDGGALAIPRGATVHGVVTEVSKPPSGTVTGSTELGLRLVSLDMGGQTYPLRSDLFRVRGPGKGARTASSAIGGAVIGAIIGGAAGGGAGAAIGAVAGGGIGTAASAAAGPTDVWIPAEALVTFHLIAPLTVYPVSEQEADRMAQGLYPGGPRLARRPPPRRFGYYRGYARPYYGYPGPYRYWNGPVYYRPYYFSGGVYYWR
ncbi:MAG TPA: BON domain-containing protein [Terracidiphilus sp.]|nr:BON domain-containing protein [Terracidiphilus sp.]